MTTKLLHIENSPGRAEASPTPYADLNAVLGDLLKQARATLGTNFCGADLQGSFALGATTGWCWPDRSRRSLDPRWSALIQAALDSRPDPWLRVHQPGDPQAVEATWLFLDYAVALAP